MKIPTVSFGQNPYISRRESEYRPEEFGGMSLDTLQNTYGRPWTPRQQMEWSYYQGLKHLKDPNLDTLAIQRHEGAVILAQRDRQANRDLLPKYHNGLGVALALAAQPLNHQPVPQIPQYRPDKMLLSHALQQQARAFQAFYKAAAIHDESPDKIDPAHFLNGANVLFDLAANATQLAKLYTEAGKKMLAAKGDTQYAAQQAILEAKGSTPATANPPAFDYIL